MDTAQAKQQITSSLFFSGLPEKDISDFLLESACRNYAKHEEIIRHGQKADRLFIVASGWIKLYRQAKTGDEAVMHMCTKGDVFGEAAVMAKGSYSFSAQAAEKASVIEIPSSFIHEKIKENPAIMERMLKTMSREMQQIQSENEHLSLMSASQRVGCLLLQLSSGMIGKGGTFPFPYDKALAASRLGMKPETFSRALAQLKPIDVQVSGPEIKIGNFEKLMEYCCHQCSSMPGECQRQDKSG
ncbi:MAG: hypothetical protein DI586_11315 [Micavibrio aeruginosavorus]|uniref:Crp/Fnr family transcriptional regulator n=1 Tax=Micavibrio aeruginosavorus TaxID=349221 RepID=A0A2W5H5H4_9BACT|nr:MAG: hypothetical protein DI586_11315 [Micavibrio aeruginosavorus]